MTKVKSATFSGKAKPAPKPEPKTRKPRGPSLPFGDDTFIERPQVFPPFGRSNESVFTFVRHEITSRGKRVMLVPL